MRKIIWLMAAAFVFASGAALGGEAAGPVGGEKKAAPKSIAEKVEELVNLLDDVDEAVSKQAEADLKNLGVPAVRPIAELIEQGEYAAQRTRLRGILAVILSEHLEELATGAESEMTEARREFAALGRAGVIGLIRRAQGPDGKIKQLALEILEELVKKYISDLGSGLSAVRDEAVATLFELNRYATPELEKLLESDSPQGMKFLAKRLTRMIKFRISPLLFLKAGTLLEGYENAGWREKREMIDFLQRQGGPDSGDALKAIVEMEEDEKVREFAAESLVRAIKGEALPFLLKQGLAGLKSLPAITRDIHMSQGIKYLTAKNYEKAEKEFKLILKDLPKDETAWYNLACAYSLWGKIEEAVDAFAKAVKWGFEDVLHIENDEDLDNIRDHPLYQRIMKNLRIKLDMPEKPEEPEDEDKSGSGPGPPPPPPGGDEEK
ncbi:MAG: TPR end-of-group domain-containing protein [Planctomycetota bacterium]|jgi:tetratricopeptide (TPR) repeat protein